MENVHITAPEHLPSRGKPITFGFVADNAFASFAKFRIFLKAISLHPNKVKTVTLIFIYLHDFLRKNADSREKISCLS
ncbi:hypothetical protein J437_LFUL011671, partial [Ladona fulva]